MRFHGVVALISERRALVALDKRSRETKPKRTMKERLPSRSAHVMLSAICILTTLPTHDKHPSHCAYFAELLYFLFRLYGGGQMLGRRN